MPGDSPRLPLAPYLFLLVAKALATSSHQAMNHDILRRIRLPNGTSQQLVSQFPDDVTFSLYGAERYLTATSTMLTTFELATGLTLNRQKCNIFWFSKHPPSAWIGTFGCTLAPPGMLSKLLRTRFGVSLHSVDGDQFLAAKITTKLKYWSSLYLSLVARAIVVNSVLLSTFRLFLSIWAGSFKILRSILGHSATICGQVLKSKHRLGYDGRMCAHQKRLECCVLLILSTS